MSNLWAPQKCGVFFIGWLGNPTGKKKQILQHLPWYFEPIKLNIITVVI
jgi:hypothetical protein